jgi:hypothetical protein
VAVGTGNFYRYRLINPNLFNRFAIKKLNNGIELVRRLQLQAPSIAESNRVLGFF